MSRNKMLFTLAVFAAVVVVLLLLRKGAETPLSVDEESETESKTVAIEQPEHVTEQTPGHIPGSVPGAGEKILPSAVEHTDLQELSNQDVSSSSRQADHLLDNPVHRGRASLQERMRAETAQHTFLHLTDNDNFLMLMPLTDGRPFSPGLYESDAVIVTKMTRVRKLLADARANPREMAGFLQQQIRTLAPKFPSQYEQFKQELEGQTGPYVCPELPDCRKTRILCTAAVYVLSQINASDSLPTLAWLAGLGDGQQDSSVVNRKFLLYAMHSLVKKSSESGLSAQAQKIRNGYLKAAQASKIPDANTVEVTTWDALYHEEDFRRYLPDHKIDLSLQPTMELERFPPLERLGKGQVEALLGMLGGFAGLS